VIGGLFAGFGMAINWTVTEVEMMLLTYSVVMGTFYSFKCSYQKCNHGFHNGMWVWGYRICMKLIKLKTQN
jgi:hypothetical protein